MDQSGSSVGFSNVSSVSRDENMLFHKILNMSSKEGKKSPDYYIHNLTFSWLSSLFFQFM